MAKTINVKTEKENKLFYGDNIEVLRKYIKDESIDLCYIDPPFNSNRNYNQIYLNQGKEDKAQAQAFIDTWEWDKIAIKGYDEIIANEQNRFSEKTIYLIQGLQKVLGKDSLLAYIVSMALRITEIHRVLKASGSFYLHCDPTASHYLKLVCDSVFSGNYINEITWKRSTAKGDGKQGAKHFGRITDIIFFYVKNIEQYTWNPQYEPYSEEAIKRDYNKIEEGTQRIYRLAPVDGPGGAAKGNPHYEFMGVSGYWRFSKDKMQKLYDEGKIIVSKTGKSLSQKMYLDESKGRQIDNFWDDIHKIAPMSTEGLGYPTQKPEKLLERIIKASSNKGDTVLDAYCGCGTTVAVAEKTGRKWIGIDITYQSISLILKRIEDSIGKSCLDTIELHGIPQDFESAERLALKDEDKVRKEFEKWIVLFYSNNRARINEKKGGDGGIDGVAFIQDRDKNSDIVNKKIIFSVKSDKNLVPAYVNQLKGKMYDQDVVMGILLTLHEPTKGMIKEANEMGMYKNELFGMEYPTLQIVSVKDLFDNGMRLTLPTITIVKEAAFKGKEDVSQTKLEL